MTLHIETTGHGPPLVLLHGWAMHSGVFAALTERLRKAHTVYLVDLPGHGYSRASHLPLALEPLTQALLEMLPPAIWLGWSLGGLLALHAAHARESATRPSALIMLCASPCFVQQPDWPHGMPTGTFSQFATGLEHNYQQTLERFIALETLGSAHAREDRRRLQQLLFARGEPSREALLAGFGMLNTVDLRTTLATLTLPSLWLSGQHDRLVHPNAMHAAAALTAHAHSITLERAGHAPMLTQADTLAAHILGFTSCA